MQGKEILEQLIGRKLTDGQVKSLHINNEVVDLLNTTFLKFDKDWIRLVCTDDQSCVELEKNNLNIFNLKTEDGVEFSVKPIVQLFPDFNKYLNKKLLGIKEVVLSKSENKSYGLSLEFEGDLTFILINHDYPIDKNEYLFEKINFLD